MMSCCLFPCMPARMFGLYSVQIGKYAQKFSMPIIVDQNNSTFHLDMCFVQGFSRMLSFSCFIKLLLEALHAMVAIVLGKIKEEPLANYLFNIFFER